MKINAGPEGLNKKTSKNGLDLNKYDDMKKMRSNFLVYMAISKGLYWFKYMEAKIRQQQ
jgi:hypothetical protein